ncbi:MAG: PTS sugar transporter subunit IIA [Ferrovum sp. 37-45-19]|jgi:PTS system nitrogen regulatory IIA component|uniref:PTS sugar transporter subunit IIA n=1 Tax=Ferrovum sp. JA12 TaxID=1356299 RepID=UPI000702E175|nr:PTS sugar transporter subunit IIA [Ferrovum sp. JA12]OYV79603.1 MAG: PTS sugar transporter subunit IIA [Ferrovum sp. 21-44-67]OYV94602.1 MAG: PTS sugar transporter subunit IIA [Ferrovum sp. 37-45-19]OZB34571.1 MAG: PTS sugar transporter subunit IIA [Ferrovum sp. 34-44-207]HQT81528.1 PTS sugar transporter subunit IIA [Ferrovaceae bacterium]KRH79500.1 PTS system fructose-specific EIIABC component [Ferrovum sp. JA12]
MDSIQKLLKLSHVLLDVEVTSKKRLFEQIGILFENKNQLSRGLVSDALFNREKLGSTGLGHGFALPHGRFKGLKTPLCAFMRLKGSIPFESPDGENVKMAFILLVPDHANEQHLALLSEIAEMFSDEELRKTLSSSDSVETVFKEIIHWTPHARRQRSTTL